VKPSLDFRAGIETVERQLSGLHVDRNNADVKGDLIFGENSALYASFGYIRKDDRKKRSDPRRERRGENSAELKAAA
jgi:hypothetical protein